MTTTSGKIVILKDGNNENILPKTSSLGVYMNDGKSLEELSSEGVYFSETLDTIQASKPELIEKVNNIETELVSVNSQLEHIKKHTKDYVTIDDFKKNIEIDYTEAFKNAITFMQENNISKLKFGNGRYEISENIIIPFEISIEGIYFSKSPKDDNIFGTVIIDNSISENSFIKINSSSKFLRGIEIKNIAIIGNGQNHCGLELSNIGWRGSFTNVFIDNFKKEGLLLDHVYDSKFDNLLITRCGDNSHALKLINATNSIIFENSQIEFCKNMFYIDSSCFIVNFNATKFEQGDCDYFNILENKISPTPFVLNESRLVDFNSCTFVITPIRMYNDNSLTPQPFIIGGKLSYSNDNHPYVFNNCKFIGNNFENIKLIDGKFSKFIFDNCTILGIESDSIKLFDSTISNTTISVNESNFSGIDIESCNIINTDAKNNAVLGESYCFNIKNDCKLDNCRIYNFKSKYKKSTTNFIIKKSKYISTITPSANIIDLSIIETDTISLSLSNVYDLSNIINGYEGQEIILFGTNTINVLGNANFSKGKNIPAGTLVKLILIGGVWRFNEDL